MHNDKPGTTARASRLNITLLLAAVLIAVLVWQGGTLIAWAAALLLAAVIIADWALQRDCTRIAELHLDAVRDDRARKQRTIAELEDALLALRQELEERSEKTNSINEMLVSMLNKSDMELADVGSFQQSLLPKKIPAFEGYRFAPLYQPSGWASGDYYDFIEINPTTLGVVIADVSGHGGRASVIMAVIRALMQIYARASMTPAKILRRINNLMSQLIPTEDFVTLFYLILDRGRHSVTYASAGQPYAIWIQGETSELHVLEDANGIPLKLFEDYEYTENSIALQPGDRILLFTDGVIEAQNPSGEMFQMQRLAEACETARTWPVRQQVELIQRKVAEYVQDNNLADDFTLLAIERIDPEKIYAEPEQMEDDLLGLVHAHDLQIEDMKLTDLPAF